MQKHNFREDVTSNLNIEADSAEAIAIGAVIEHPRLAEKVGTKFRRPFDNVCGDVIHALRQAGGAIYSPDVAWKVLQQAGFKAVDTEELRAVCIPAFRRARNEAVKTTDLPGDMSREEQVLKDALAQMRMQP